MANVFIEEEMLLWSIVAPGMQRAILAYDDSLMMVKVKFDKEAIGAMHHHPHVQYIDLNATIPKGFIIKFFIPYTLDGLTC